MNHQNQACEIWYRDVVQTITIPNCTLCTKIVCNSGITSMMAFEMLTLYLANFTYRIYT
jgi:hypothetical protein